MATQTGTKNLHTRVNRLAILVIKDRHPDSYQFLYEGWLAECKTQTDYTGRKRPSDRARSAAFTDIKDMYYEEFTAERARILAEEKVRVGWFDARINANKKRIKHGERVGDTTAKRQRRNQRAEMDAIGVWNRTYLAAAAFMKTYDTVNDRGDGTTVPSALDPQVAASAFRLRDDLAKTFADVNYVRGRITI